MKFPKNVACQKLYPSIVIYAWTTNGEIWQFGKLGNNVFVQDTVSYSLSTEPKKIVGILDWIFTYSTKQAQNYLANEKKHT